MRGGGHGPLGWAATLLIAVAYAHALPELAAAVLALTVAVRLLTAPARDALLGRAHSSGLSGRRRCAAVGIDRRPPVTARGRDRAGGSEHPVSQEERRAHGSRRRSPLVHNRAGGGDET